MLEKISFWEEANNGRSCSQQITSQFRSSHSFENGQRESSSSTPSSPALPRSISFADEVCASNLLFKWAIWGTRQHISLARMFHYKLPHRVSSKGTKETLLGKLSLHEYAKAHLLHFSGRLVRHVSPSRASRKGSRVGHRGSRGRTQQDQLELFIQLGLRRLGTGQGDVSVQREKEGQRQNYSRVHVFFFGVKSKLLHTWKNEWEGYETMEGGYDDFDGWHVQIRLKN